MVSAGAMLPSAGGDYTYLQRAFGDQVAYSWVFMSFTIQRPASLSIVGVIAGHYASALLNGGDSVSVTAETPTHIRWLATAYVGLLTLVNLLPIALMSRVNAAMALSKPLLVLALIALGVAFALQTQRCCGRTLHRPGRPAATMTRRVVALLLRAAAAPT